LILSKLIVFVEIVFISLIRGLRIQILNKY